MMHKYNLPVNPLMAIGNYSYQFLSDSKC